MPNQYPLGTSVKVSVIFRDPDDVIIDPDNVYCMIQLPDRTETTYEYGVDAELVRDGVGRYHLWVDTDTAGRYCYRFKGEGSRAMANEQFFHITGSVFTTP